VIDDTVIDDVLLGRRVPVEDEHDGLWHEGVTNTLDVWEICWGDPDLEWLAQSSVGVFGHATTHRISKTLTALSSDGTVRR
jgi:hypothetical protein